MARRPQLSNFRRIVVKVGSSLLIDSDAGEVRAAWLSALADDIAKLHGDYGLLAEAALRPGRGRLLSSVAKVTGMRRRG